MSAAPLFAGKPRGTAYRVGPARVAMGRHPASDAGFAPIHDAGAGSDERNHEPLLERTRVSGLRFWRDLSRTTRICRPLKEKLRSWSRHRRGSRTGTPAGFIADRAGIVVSLEFAIVLPLLLTIAMGVVEVGRALSWSAQAQRYADAAGGIVSSATDPITTDTINLLLDAAGVLVRDAGAYGGVDARGRPGNVRLGITSIALTIPPGCSALCGFAASVQWSAGSVSAWRACGSDLSGVTIPFPDGSVPASAIRVDVTIDFTPRLGKGWLPSPTLRGSTFLVPRYRSAIAANFNQDVGIKCT